MLNVGATSVKVLMLNDGIDSVNAPGSPLGMVKLIAGIVGAAGMDGRDGAAMLLHVSENVGA
jgi:hypothetical protein